MKSRIIILFMMLILVCLSRNMAFAEINRHLSLQTNYSYLLIFDEKIQKFTVGAQKAIKAELLTSIFDSNHELLINPLLSEDTNLIVWTDSNIYNFDISINKEAVNVPNIIKVNCKNTTLSQEAQADFEDMSLDTPPKTEEDNVFNFEIDQPPKVIKTQS